MNRSPKLETVINHNLINDISLCNFMSHQKFKKNFRDLKKFLFLFSENMCKERIFKQISRMGFFRVYNYDFFFQKWQNMKSKKESFESVFALQRPPFK